MLDSIDISPLDEVLEPSVVVIVYVIDRLLSDMVAVAIVGVMYMSIMEIAVET